MGKPGLESKRTNGQYRLLDAWRGAAAVWVVMAHASHAILIHEAPELAQFPLFTFSTFGQLGVIMFFVISGYCITAAAMNTLRKGDSPAQFMWARVRRLYPPYIASSAMNVLLGALLAFLALHRVIPVTHHPIPFARQPLIFYFAALTLTQSLFHTQFIAIIYWSLCYEFAFYIIVALLLGAFARRSRVYVCTGLNVITVVCLAWLTLAQPTCTFPFNLWPYFGFGALIFMLLAYPDERMPKISFSLVTGMALLYAVVREGPYYLGEGIGHPSSRMMTLFALGFTLVLLVLYRFDATLAQNRVVRAFAWLGSISYSLYVSHYYILGIPQQLASKVGLVGGLAWISLVTQICIAVAVGYGFHILFERPFLSSRAKVREAEIMRQAAHL